MKARWGKREPPIESETLCARPPFCEISPTNFSVTIIESQGKHDGHFDTSQSHCYRENGMVEGTSIYVGQFSFVGEIGDVD